MPGCGIPGSKIHLRHQPTAKDIAMWIGIGGHRDDADNWFMLRGSLAGHGRRISYDFMGTNTQFFLQALPTSSSFVGRQAGGIDRHRMTALYADDGVQKTRRWWRQLRKRDKISPALFLGARVRP